MLQGLARAISTACALGLLPARAAAPSGQHGPIELRRQACAELEGGDVAQLQVVAGCPTTVE